MPTHDVRCTNPQCAIVRNDVVITDTTIVFCPLCNSVMQWIPTRVAVVGLRPRSDQAAYNPNFDDREEHTRALRRFMAEEEAAGRLSAEVLTLDPADLWCEEGRLHPAQHEMEEDERGSREADIKTEFKECEKGLEDVDRALHNLSPETVKEQMQVLQAIQRPTKKDFEGVDFRAVRKVQAKP